MVAFGTETVYGLGADARNSKAVAQIFALKGRPHFNPLIIHLAQIQQAFELIEWTPLADRLASAFWPGPLTLVGNRRIEQNDISLLCSAGTNSLAVRVPAKGLEFLRACACPVAAPSANRSGFLSPTQAQHVFQSFGAELCPAILDNGPASFGLESSILDLRFPKPVLLRAGSISREALEVITGPLELQLSSDKPDAPGQLRSHYAPKVPLRINVKAPEANETWLAFAHEGTLNPPHMDLSPRGDIFEAAARFFAYLHKAEGYNQPIAVAPIPNEGLGLAINDRLIRAAQNCS